MRAYISFRFIKYLSIFSVKISRSLVEKVKHEKLVAQIVKSNHSSHPDRIVKLESSRPPRKLHAFKMLIQRIRQYLLFDLQKA